MKTRRLNGSVAIVTSSTARSARMNTFDRVLRHHVLIHVSDIKPELVLSGPVNCKNHKDSTDQTICNCYCTKCETMMCTLCAVTEHSGHKIEKIDDAIKRCKTELAALRQHSKRFDFASRHSEVPRPDDLMVNLSAFA